MQLAGSRSQIRFIERGDCKQAHRRERSAGFASERQFVDLVLGVMQIKRQLPHTQPHNTMRINTASPPVISPAVSPRLKGKNGVDNGNEGFGREDKG